MARIYLDWASAAPVSPRALQAFQKASRAYGNPSAPHTEGREAKAILEAARVEVARLCEVKPDAVIFTSGATEANALAIQGTIRAHTEKGTRPENMHVLYLPTAHSSVVKTMEALQRDGVLVEELKLEHGAIDTEALKAQLRPETVLVSIDAVCGETGTRYDTRAVARTLPEGVLVHVDASQLPFAESFERDRLKADLLTLDAQKVGGVRGVGALIAPRSTSLSPVVFGGGQERGLRSGSEPHALIAAFSAALKECAHGRAAFIERAQRYRALLQNEILSIPNTNVNEGKEQAPHILNVSIIGRDTDYLVALLDEAGFAVSTKSACETDAVGSRVVHRMFGDEARASSTLRISFGPSVTESDLKRFLKALTRAVAFLDAHTLRGN